MPRPYTLITGASGGIGLALAQTYAKNGHPLILVARNQENLAQAAKRIHNAHGVEVVTIPLDLSAENATLDLYQSCAQQNLPIDQLVNNAGFACYGTFHQIPLAEQLAMVDLNIRMLTDLSYRFIPLLLQFPESRLINVASTAAFFPGPLMASYYATKAYVLSLSEALAEEYRTTHLAVCALCPGPTKSGFQARAKMERSRLVQRGLMTPEEVAHAAYPAIQHGDPVIVPGLLNRLTTYLPRFLPRALTARIIAGAQEPV